MLLNNNDRLLMRKLSGISCSKCHKSQQNKNKIKIPTSPHKKHEKIKASHSIGLIYECLQYFSYIMMASSIGGETGQKGTQILKFHIK